MMQTFGELRLCRSELVDSMLNTSGGPGLRITAAFMVFILDGVWLLHGLSPGF